MVIFNVLSNGSIWHIVLKVLPTISVVKYIPLVNATNWTIILEIPDDDFSVVMVPIRIPNEMNNIDIGITAKELIKKKKAKTFEDAFIKTIEEDN